MDDLRRWDPGQIITRRERLGLQPDGVTAPSPATGVWLDLPVVVVEDRPDHLATFIETGAPFHFPDGEWPTPDGLHPWHGRTGWSGHGVLMVQRPEEHVAVWHFWTGPDRRFSHWYLNLQTSPHRTENGYDTQDLELDIIVWPDGTHEVKDAEVLDDRVAEGRFSAELVSWIRAYGDQLVGRLERDGPWWDRGWVDWRPDR
ncbi:MAG: DUF402 domain-containing protein [Actinomycetota bacterium]